MQGAAAHGCNPYYAKDIDVIVPNISPNSYEAIKTGSDMIEAGYKSEHSLETAYAGYQTRKIIMEERNVYCGPYNVMVLPTGWVLHMLSVDRGSTVMLNDLAGIERYHVYHGSTCIMFFFQR